MIKLSTAVRLACRAHDGQVDKIGDPYILHVMRVASAFIHEPYLQGIALLHDVVEDSDLTLQDLRDNGMPELQVASIDALTRRDGEMYREFIKRVKRDDAARRVKIADLHDNLHPKRLHALHREGIDTKSMERRYRDALQDLQK